MLNDMDNERLRGVIYSMSTRDGKGTHLNIQRNDLVRFNNFLVAILTFIVGARLLQYSSILAFIFPCTTFLDVFRRRLTTVIDVTDKLLRRAAMRLSASPVLARAKATHDSQTVSRTFGQQGAKMPRPVRLDFVCAASPFRRTMLSLRIAEMQCRARLNMKPICVRDDAEQ